jgi:hypothetical protein
MKRLILNTLAACTELLGLPETAAILRKIADPVAANWQLPNDKD